MSLNTERLRIVSLIGIAQIIASASTQYMPAVIAKPGAAELGLAATTFFVGVSVALIVSAIAGPSIGRLVDRIGGRPVLMLSNIIYAISMVLLSMAQDTFSILAAYAILGIATAGGQFEVAFATLVNLFGRNSRDPITGVTLFAGFASFIGWNISIQILELWGWQGVCLFWAAIQLCVALPLNYFIPLKLETAQSSDQATDATKTRPSTLTEAQSEQQSRRKSRRREQSGRQQAFLLAYVFAANAFVGMGLMMHLPELLQLFGIGVALSFVIGSLVGPAQVLGRLVDFFIMKRWHPIVGTRFAAATHPVGALLMLILGAPVASLFVILHGMGNGVLIMSRGTLPLALFGPLGYGRMQGWLMLPAKLAQACAPFLFGMAMEYWGTGTLWMTGFLGLSVFVGLYMIRTSDSTP